MAKKYKIVQRNYVAIDGEIKGSEFMIRRRFLFLWIPVIIEEASIMEYGKVLLFSRYMSFNSKEYANKILNDLFLSETCFKYRGVKIGKFYSDHNKYLYVILSYYNGTYGGRTAYHFSYTLEGIKKEVDRTIPVRVKRV